MSKMFRLALMLGLAALAYVSSTPKPAYALGSCRALNGRSCTTPGNVIACLTGSTIGSPTGLCVCQDNHTQDCSV